VLELLLFQALDRPKLTSLSRHPTRARESLSIHSAFPHSELPRSNPSSSARGADQRPALNLSLSRKDKGRPQAASSVAVVLAGRLGDLVKRYVEGAGLKVIAVDTHAAGGYADPASTGMLGHASIETTQVYTRLTITDLIAAHYLHSPIGRFHRPGATRTKSAGD
jgi:hypothetical protein